MENHLNHKHFNQETIASFTESKKEKLESELEKLYFIKDITVSLKSPKEV